MTAPNLQELQEQLERRDRELFDQAKLVVQLRHELEETCARLQREREQHEETRDRWRLVAADLGDALLRLAGAKSLLSSLRQKRRDELRDARHQIAWLEEKVGRVGHAVDRRRAAPATPAPAAPLKKPVGTAAQSQRCLEVGIEECIKRQCPSCPAYLVPPAPAAKEVDRAP